MSTFQNFLRIPTGNVSHADDALGISRRHTHAGPEARLRAIAIAYDLLLGTS